MYSAFLEMFKKKKPKVKYTKYYIPCYDVVKNEINFTEFFTEEIITKPTQEKILENLQSPELLNFDFNPTLKDSSNPSPRRLKPVKISEEDKHQIFKEKEEQLLLEELSLRWQKIKNISGFNENNYLSSYYYDYFSRPLFSRFFLPQNLNLYSFNSTSPIPDAISVYSFVDVCINYHFYSLMDLNIEELDEFDDEDLDSSMDEINDVSLIRRIIEDLSSCFKQSKKISLFYVVDTLIKDSQKLLEDTLNNKINEFGRTITNTDDLDYFGEMNTKLDEEYEKKLRFLLQKFRDIKSDKNMKMVLKIVGYEEYLYGESSLSSYYFIRNKVRQKECVRLILKAVPSYILQPPLFSFPPIIRVDKDKNITYDELFELYNKYYHKHEIIFRIYKSSKKQIDRYLKKDLSRTKHLTKFTESGDCEFPLIIKINSINNVFEFIKWFNNEDYCKNHNSELILDYFNIMKKYRITYKTNFQKFIGLLKNSLSSKKEEDNESEIQNKIYETVDESKKEKIIKKCEISKKEDLIIQKKLNYLTLVSYYQSEIYNSFSNLISNSNFFQNGINNIIENLIKKNSTILSHENTINTKTDIIFSRDDYVLNKYKNFLLKKHPAELMNPVYIRIKIYLLYGSYCMQKFQTEPYLIKNFIKINDKIIFNDKDNHTLISHLPLETRIAIRIKAYDHKLSKGFTLGCCQIPLFKENGQMQNGNIEFEIWPNVKIFPRVNISTPFARKLVSEEKLKRKYKKIQDEIDNAKNENLNELDLINKYKKRTSKKKIIIDADQKKEQREIISHLYDKIVVSKMPLPFLEMQKIKKREILLKKAKEEFKKEKTRKIFMNSYDINQNHNDEKAKSRRNTLRNFSSKSFLMINNISNEFVLRKNIEKTNKNNNNPSITIQFPKFASPLVHSFTNVVDYRRFLDIKYKDQKNYYKENDYNEIRKLFGNSQKEVSNIIDDFQKSTLSKNRNNRYYNKQNNNKNINSNKDEIYPSNIWDYLEKTFHSLVEILKKDPLEQLDEKEIIAILICRDYISTIPNALQLFLRAIDWRNPFEVQIAHSYLKKWSPIECEDAVSLLDARFPDTVVREYAINRLRNFSDEEIDNFMQILCQCLLYETFLINPLSDFLIERSLKNPSLLGTKFIWFSRINMKNPLFEERLSAYIAQFLMLCGNKFMNRIFREINFNYLILLSDEYFEEKNKDKKKFLKEVEFIKKQRNAELSNKPICLPIDPTFLCKSFIKFEYRLIEFSPREKIKNSECKVRMKLGEDLRQDTFIIIILKLMDKLWLQNNLDLKLITYKVFPTDLNFGYIELIDSTSLNAIKNSSGMGGALDREIIIKHLRCSNSDDSSYEISFNDKTDNFIKSLAAYCVATCVLGIANRLTRKILIKNNGIFLHTDFSRALGIFKKTLGIKKERNKFLLTPEMANVYIYEQKEELFKKYCVKAFNILRHNASKLINLFIIMSTAGLNSFYGISDVEYIKHMLVLDKPNDEDAGNYFIEQIRKCKNERLRQLDFLLQNLKI